MKKLRSRLRWYRIKFNARPHFWIKPIYSDTLIQGIYFPNGMEINKLGSTVNHCAIGGDFHGNTWKSQ